MKRFVAILALLFAFSITAPVITVVFADDKPADEKSDKPAKKKGKKAAKKKGEDKKEEKKEEAK
jgi:hypothetical protein